ncbi:MAG: LamG domain-containing protein [Verrucomicrobiales bacterium]
MKRSILVARVRVNILGEFSDFTFATWVRVDSLDRTYNALFMCDSYETGEPHWQVREDGALMLSVMVDDSKPNPGAPNAAGLHRVYYSPPIWEMSMSGQWMHVASVYDPAARAVSHYVNGKQISTQEIIDKSFIDTLRIGNSEIGNWGLPSREDPWFALRNLNGRMDEIAIFDAALGEKESATLFKKSLGALNPRLVRGRTQRRKGAEVSFVFQFSAPLRLCVRPDFYSLEMKFFGNSSASSLLSVATEKLFFSGS